MLDDRKNHPCIRDFVEAPEKALVNRKLAPEGGDPHFEKRHSHAVPTFAEAPMRVLEQKSAGWSNPRHARECLSSLRRLAPTLRRGGCSLRKL